MLEEAINREPLIDVFDTNDDSEAMVVRGLLEASEIEVLLTSVEAQAGILPFSNAPLGHMRLQVFESEAEEARQVIAQYKQAGEQGVEAAAVAAAVAE
jgi:hypothetical protein